jgi:hypothetical protein
MRSSGSYDGSLAGTLTKIHLLAAGRVYRLPASPLVDTSSYLARFTLAARQPKLISGSFVSVALSLGSPPVAVSDCLSLCCPDFPLLDEAISR